MDNLLNTLLPIFLLILFGYFLKRINFASDEFWKQLDKLNYYILFPSLLIYKLSTANMLNITDFNFIYVALISISILSAVLIIYNKYYSTTNSSFTSIFQGGVRFNTYVFFALIAALFGDEALIIAAILAAFIIPFINVLLVSMFSIYTTNSKFSIVSFLLTLIKNPLILGCVIGGGLNFFDIRLFLILENTLAIISTTALPLGVLSVGVGLTLSHLSSAKKDLLVSLVAKLILLPLIVIGVGNIFSIDDLTFSILIIFASMPTAISSYILAKELGGDIKLMASIISIQTLVSMLTIFIFTQAI